MVKSSSSNLNLSRNCINFCLARVFRSAASAFAPRKFDKSKISARVDTGDKRRPPGAFVSQIDFIFNFSSDTFT